MRYIVFIFFMTYLPLAQAFDRIKAGYDPVVDEIADNYEAGAFLIYNCVDKHWTCVLKSYHDQCKAQFNHDRFGGKINLRCVPFDEAPTKKSCFQKQLYLVSQSHGTRFCVNDRWKEKEIEL